MHFLNCKFLFLPKTIGGLEFRDSCDVSMRGTRSGGINEELSLPPRPITRSRAKKFKESLQIYEGKLLEHVEDKESKDAQEIIHNQLGSNVFYEPHACSKLF